MLLRLQREPLFISSPTHRQGPCSWLILVISRLRMNWLVFFWLATTANGFSWTFHFRTVIPRWRSAATAALYAQASSTRPRDVRFVSPLLEYGYPPAVEEFERNGLAEKPLFLYLPGFDGTFVCPFLQFPELSTVFDVRCMTVGSNDRSTFDELKETVLEFLETESLVPDETSVASASVSLEKDDNTRSSENKSPTTDETIDTPTKSFRQQKRRPIYLAGESFGGILATEVAIEMLSNVDMNENSSKALKGLTLINAATCFDRSDLGELAPRVAQLPAWRYPAGLLELLPLFTDRYSVDQLFLILKAEALPSIVNTPAREAYMGRVAFSLPFVLPVMTQGTFQWRLEEWLETGCARRACQRLAQVLQQQQRDDDFPTLLVAGENDNTLPSVQEAERLASLWPNAQIHVVQDAGHSSTCGSRVDLAALLRHRFAELREHGGRTEMTSAAASGAGVSFGMEPRYDGASIGLSPLEYWSDSYFRKFKPGSR